MLDAILYVVKVDHKGLYKDFMVRGEGTILALFDTGRKQSAIFVLWEEGRVFISGDPISVLGSNSDVTHTPDIRQMSPIYIQFNFIFYSDNSHQKLSRDNQHIELV